MEKISRWIVKYKLVFLIAFIVLTVGLAICIPFVEVNYDDTSYLPKDSETKQSLNLLYEEFGEGGNASAMIKDVSIEQALQYKAQIEGVKNVSSVLWLDDALSGFLDGVVDELNASGIAITEAECVNYTLAMIDALPSNASELSYAELFAAISKVGGGKENFMPFLLGFYAEIQDKDVDIGLVSDFKPQLEAFYKDGCAYFQIFFTYGDYSNKTTEAIKEIRSIDADLYMSGNAAINYNSRQSVTQETSKAMIVAGVVILIILLVMTKSYWEPVIYLITIGMAVLMNMGSNIVFGSISYMTQGVAAVLQLALTIDYSIFLLNRYRREKKGGLSSEEAMAAAIKYSFSPLSASSLTTIASFVALMFMSYKIGLDIGMVLTKGVIISIISVFTFMPALVLYTDKLIVKSQHKSPRLSFRKLSKVLVKTRYVLPFVMIAVMLPCVYFQTQNIFTYGNEASLGSEGSQIQADKEEIEAVFGTQNQLVILVPQELYGKEYDASCALLALTDNGVESVQSISLVRASGMESLLPQALQNQFLGKSATRIILNLSVAKEGAETKALVSQIKQVLDTQFGDLSAQSGANYRLIGETVATIEIENLVNLDYDIISYVSIALVGLVLVLTFKSLIIPIVLMAVILGSIYVNMTIPFLMKEPMVFIGYLLVSSILLGATIDYAILFTDNYMGNRRTMNKIDASRHAMAQSSRALVTSAGILTFAGLSIGLVCSLPATVVFGKAIARGGICSFVCVMVLLPQLLMIFDTPIRYTTWRGKTKMIENSEATPSDDVSSGDVG